MKLIGTGLLLDDIARSYTRGPREGATLERVAYLRMHTPGIKPVSAREARFPPGCSRVLRCLSSRHRRNGILAITFRPSKRLERRPNNYTENVPTNRPRVRRFTQG